MVWKWKYLLYMLVISIVVFIVFSVGSLGYIFYTQYQEDKDYYASISSSSIPEFSNADDAAYYFMEEELTERGAASMRIRGKQGQERVFEGEYYYESNSDKILTFLVEVQLSDYTQKWEIVEMELSEDN